MCGTEPRCVRGNDADTDENVVQTFAKPLLKTQQLSLAQAANCESKANARGSAWDAHCKQSRDRKGALEVWTFKGADYPARTICFNSSRSLTSRTL